MSRGAIEIFNFPGLKLLAYWSVGFSSKVLLPVWIHRRPRPQLLPAPADSAAKVV